MNDIRIDFQTLTPLWTGGVERKSDQIRETGLIGSLRWWYEGIVRGMGGYACWLDSNGKSTCQFDVNKYYTGRSQCRRETNLIAESGLCPVCQFFGATGWKRRFRLEVTGLATQPLFFMASRNVYQAAGNWLWRMFGGEAIGGTRTGRGANVKFEFRTQVIWGENATLHFFPLGLDAEEVMARILFLMDTIARYGGLGAKTQNGFGQIKITSDLNADLIKKGRDLIQKDVKIYKQWVGKTQDPDWKPDTELFNLKNFFSRTYELIGAERYIEGLREVGTAWTDYKRYYVPCAFDIRYKSQQRNPFTGQGRDFGLRPWFRTQWGDEVAHRLFGRSDARSDEQRSAGRIRVSHLYKLKPGGPWNLKVWGDVPPGIKLGKDQQSNLEEVMKNVDEFIKGKMFPNSKIINQFQRMEVLGS